MSAEMLAHHFGGLSGAVTDFAGSVGQRQEHYAAALQWIDAEAERVTSTSPFPAVSASRP